MKIVEIVDVDIDRKTKTLQEPASKPGGWTVVILNDTVTPYQVVVEALCYATGMSEGEAMEVMTSTHSKGWHPVKSYASRDLADSVASKIENHARSNTNWDHIRQFNNHTGPWPLTAEVMEAGGA